MTDLSGKTIVLTGASKGIGAATAGELVSAGARLIAHYGRDAEGARDAVRHAERGQVTLLQADFNDMVAVDRFWNDARSAAGGRVDVLINNAGIMRQTGGILDPVDEWDAVWAEAMAVNVHAPARLMRHAVGDWLKADQPGAIIGIGSWVSTRGTSNPGAIAYAASKAAISAATKTIARNYADRGILAYVISPGVVRTRMSEESAARTGGEAAVTASLPMREWVPPEEIAALAAFLAEGRARHLSGGTIDINGAAYIR
ncbi:SDR family NAD(P)-dependent oxidoreductase [Oceanibium sediminis]|uniref:SDR family NAD(P)-dependent oxidoreductase n=1 Tax=Oceanibium sediminis TaxID=2026339 RepID=UPI000DD47509|nr:SDR family oxidoreductase [Oceanibium sediminis]